MMHLNAPQRTVWTEDIKAWIEGSESEFVQSQPNFKEPIGLPDL